MCSPSLRPFVFLDIPPEVRNIIYNYLLWDQFSLHIHEPNDQLTGNSTCRVSISSASTSTSPSMLTTLKSTCRTIAREAHSSLRLTRLVFTTNVPLDLSFSEDDEHRPSTADAPAVDIATLIPRRHQPTITTLVVQSLHIHRLLPIPFTLHATLPQLSSLLILTNFENGPTFRMPSELYTRYHALRDSGQPWTARGIRHYAVYGHGKYIWNNVFPRHLTDVILAMELGWQETTRRTGLPVQHDTFRFPRFWVLYREFLTQDDESRIVTDVLDVTYDFWWNKIVDMRQGDPRLLSRRLTWERGHMWTRQTVPNVVIPTVEEMETMAAMVGEVGQTLGQRWIAEGRDVNADSDPKDWGVDTDGEKKS